MSIYPKSLLATLGIFTCVHVIGQVGIGKEDFYPETDLHIIGDNENAPLRLREIKTTTIEPTSYLTLSPDEKVYVTNSLDGVAFVLPTQVASAGVELLTSDNTGNATYQIGVETPSSANKWKKIPGVEIDFEILQATNIINISLEGGSQYGVVNGTMNLGTNIYYAIGLFVDGVLQDVRILPFKGNGQANKLEKWYFSSYLKNLSEGSHTIEVYVSRRYGVTTTSQAERSLMVGTNTPGVTNNNLFMSQVILNVFGKYGN